MVRFWVIYIKGSGPIPFRSFDWKKKEKLLQELICLMLETDPKKRISVEDALQHPWFMS